MTSFYTHTDTTEFTHEPSELTIRLLSDLHFSNSPEWSTTFPGLEYDSRKRLDLIMERAIERDSDIVLILGDITDKGHVPSYPEFDSLVNTSGLKAELLVTPGNHDVRQALRDHVRSGLQNEICIDGDKIHFMAHRGAHRLFLLDSAPVIPGERSCIGPEGLSWLEDQLKVIPSGERAWIFTHYPPESFNEWLSKRAIMGDGGDLGRILQNHRAVIGAVFSGHTHQHASYRIGDIPGHSIAPGSVALCSEQTADGRRIVEDSQGIVGLEHLTLFPNGTYELSVERVDVSGTLLPRTA